VSTACPAGAPPIPKRLPFAVKESSLLGSFLRPTENGKLRKAAGERGRKA